MVSNITFLVFFVVFDLSPLTPCINCSVFTFIGVQLGLFGSELFVLLTVVSVGHGLSDGDRVHVSNTSTYANDVVQHINIIKEKHPNVPIFIIGHSMVSCCR